MIMVVKQNFSAIFVQKLIKTKEYLKTIISKLVMEATKSTNVNVVASLFLKQNI